MRRAGRALAGLVLVAGCGSPRSFVADPGRYDRVPAAWSEPLATARVAFERGDARTAFLALSPLCLQQPWLVQPRVFLQELELSLLASEGRLGELAAGSADEAREVLARAYEARADERPAAEEYVLAARLAGEPEAALALLDEADTLDSRCVWVHYARAWWRYKQRRFKEARASLRTALRLDGGHLPSLRLHATLLAGGGDPEEAAVVLEVWLERTADDPLFAAAERADALLDLAALRVLLGRPARALELLDQLDPRAVRDPVRAEEVRTAALEARGDLVGALAAAGRAASMRSDAFLPLVHRALLLRRAGDREGEAQAWRDLLARVDAEASAAPDDGMVDFEAALFRLQARTRLERLALPVAP